MIDGRSESTSSTMLDDIRTQVDDRRYDTHIRDAINDLQALLYDPGAKEKAVQQAGQHLKNITESDFSVCILNLDKQAVPLSQDTHFKLIGDPKHKSLMDMQNISAYLYNGLCPGRAECVQKPFSDSIASLFSSATPFSSLLILPVFTNNKLNALFLLAKKTGTYGLNIQKRITPLLGAVMCSLHSAELSRGDLVSLEQKIKSNQFLASFISASPLAVFVVAPDQSIALVNPSAETLFVNTDAEHADNSLRLLGLPIENFIPNYAELFLWSRQNAHYGKSLSSKSPVVWPQQTIFRLDGTHGLADITAFRYTYGEQTFTTLQIVDVTHFKEEYSLAKSEDNHLLAIRHLVPIAIITIDEEWCCDFANEKWVVDSGLTIDETINQGWMKAVHSEDSEVLFKKLREAFRNGDDYAQDLRLVSPLGNTKWFEFNSRIAFSDAGEIKGFLATFTEITARVEYQQKLKKVAEHDVLTGLVNRGLFMDRLQQAFYVAEREDTPVCVMFLDLDGFKQINDKLGHDYGDELLKQVASRLSNCLRKNDTIARFGGDEFVVLLGHDDHPTEMPNVADKLIKAVAEPYVLNDKDVNVTVSVGVATGTYKNSSSSILLKQADAALYKAKNHGKNTFEIYDNHVTGEYKTQSFLLNQLKRGVQQNMFTLEYLPVKNIDTGDIVSFEAYLIFKDVNEQLMKFDEIMPILEDSGLIREVGPWAIREVCRTIVSLKNENLLEDDFYVSINISVKQVLGESLYNTIVEQCERHNISPSMIALEIDEKTMDATNEKLQKALLKLHVTGIRIILDQFGSGAASITELLSSCFEQVKLSPLLASQLHQSKRSQTVIKGITDLAISCGLEVVVEVDDTDKVKDQLTALNLLKIQNVSESEILQIGQLAEYLKDNA